MMSASRRLVAALNGMVLFALAVSGAALAQDVQAAQSVAKGSIPAIGQQQTSPSEPPPPDETLQVRVVAVEEVGEGAPLRFQVHFPDRLDPTGFALTYAVDPGGGTARPGVDYREPSGVVELEPGAPFGTFAIPTLLNPNAGGATLLVVVSHDGQPAGRGLGGIVDRPPPRVDVTSASVDEGDTLLFDVAIDPAAEVRGPWIYQWRVEDVSAIAEIDYLPPQTGTLRFDEEGRPLDAIRIETIPGDTIAGDRTLQLVVTAGDVPMGSGQGIIRDRVAPPTTGTPEPGGTTAYGQVELTRTDVWGRTTILIGLTALFLLAVVAGWKLRERRLRVAAEKARKSVEQVQSPVPPVTVAMTSGPRIYAPVEPGLPELVIEMRAGAALCTPPARWPVEAVGG